MTAFSSLDVQYPPTRGSRTREITDKVSLPKSGESKQEELQNTRIVYYQSTPEERGANSPNHDPTPAAAFIVNAITQTPKTNIDEVSTYMREIFGYYDVIEEEIVVKFLRQHPYLSEILLDARESIKTFFSPNPNATLSVFTDPEGGIPELFVTVTTEGSPEEAFVKMSAFDKEWFAQYLPQTKGNLNFDINPI